MKIGNIRILKPIHQGDGSWSWRNVALFAWKRFSIEWHPHVSACKYGVYWNKNLKPNPPYGAGLKGCMNLPILGDFSLWI